MKKSLNKITLILLVIIQLAACQKKCVIVPPMGEDVCQIRQVVYTTTLSSGIDTAKITYNKFGNPVSALVSQTRTLNPHVWFRYDQYNRLTDCIGAYPYNDAPDPLNTPAVISFEYWYRYVYADQNPSSMPVSDTLRTMGYYVDGQFLSFSNMRFEHFEYDSQNRIIQVNSSLQGFSQTYSYDANGNLIRPGLVYDNKKNFRQTNKVWMFIDRDFSKNNPYTAITYNNAGFPTKFADPNMPSLSFNYFLLRQMTIFTLDYSCSIMPKGKQ